MALFPVSPSNNDTTTVNGIQYTYNSSIPAWVRTATSLGNAIIGNLTVSGAAVASGNITAAYFIGNGSLLSGITGGGGGANISNGTSNVQVYSSGNVTTSVTGISNVLVVATTGINVSGNVAIPAAANLRIPGGSYGQTIVTDGAGNLSFSSVAIGNLLINTRSYSIVNVAVGLNGVTVVGRTGNIIVPT